MNLEELFLSFLKRVHFIQEKSDHLNFVIHTDPELHLLAHGAVRKCLYLEAASNRVEG